MYYSEIKHSRNTLEKFLLCFQMPVVVFHIVIHSLRFILLLNKIETV